MEWGEGSDVVNVETIKYTVKYSESMHYISNQGNLLMTVASLIPHALHIDNLMVFNSMNRSWKTDDGYQQIKTNTSTMKYGYTYNVYSSTFKTFQ